MEFTDVKAKINFFLREKLYNSMLQSCNDALKKFVGEVHLNLYHALALYLNNRFTECIRELEVLRSETDVRLASTIGLIYTHKRTQTTDSEVLGALDTALREHRKNANASDFYNSAFVLYCLEKYEKALEYVEKSLKLSREQLDVQGLKGWILIKLAYQNKANVQDCIQVFEKCVRESKRHLDLSMGLCEAYMLDKNYSDSLNVANKAIVRFPSMNLPLMYKAKILFSMQDFDPAIESCNRLLSADENNYIALKLLILIMICRNGNYSEAALEISKFSQILQVAEPKNAKIFIENGALFSRLCARDESVLEQTHGMLEKAVYINSGDIDAMIELGYQCLLQNKSKDALKYYRTASKTDNTSFNALLGMTLSEMSENTKTDQIKQQIFFLLELETEPNPLLLYMRAKLADGMESSVQFLEEACSEQLKPIMNMPFCDYYLTKLDADFLLQVVKYYLTFAPKPTGITQTTTKTTQPNNILTNALNTLRIVTRALPGHEEAHLLFAQVQFSRGDYFEATQTLNHITSLDTSSSDAHLLMAQIHLNNSQFDRAAQSLEVGLSHDFQVRERPQYHLIFGLIYKAKNNLDDAIKSFNTALSLMNSIESKTRAENLLGGLSMSDKATIYIELINAHRDSNQMHEASKLMEDAIQEFRHTPEEARFMILNAESAANLDDVEKAIDMLSKVTPNESYYLTARTKLAEIFLIHRQDKKAFMNCYQEMVQFNMSPESFLLLGDAYMTILEPDKALEAYNNALQMNPKDVQLMCKMGKALIDTHYYKKAVKYYKDSIESTGYPELKLQLSELYMQMKEFDKSEELLTTEIEREKILPQNEDLILLQHRSKIYKLLAEVMERSGKVKSASEVLRAGRDNQSRVRKILSVEQAVIPTEEIDLLVNFNVKLAEIAVSTRDNGQAINYYKDALAVSPTNHKILAALAKLYMQLNHLELCQQTCSKLLALDNDNEMASVLMADISFRKVDFDMAVFHFTQLVNKQPTNWVALVRLVEVLRRTGNLGETSQYLKQAEQFSENNREPGLFYCTALYQWYTGNLNSALRNFNQARQDPDWGADAIINMIEICLNPDDDMFGDQFNVDVDDFDYRDSRTMAIKTAERLLRELKQISFGESTLKCRLLQNFILLASKEKYNMERALEDFVNLASQENYKDQVGPILGVATAYTMLKQSQRAKTQLKRLIKAVWTFEDAEYLERCWLLLADYYIQSGKYDLSSDLIKKVLQYNKASSKAYEFAGFISEKEQKYRDAAAHYEAAWKYNGKNNPSIGYRLAYNLMKCKRYADAIDVGQLIYKMHPEYVKIKKDILDKSINNLRT
ncbi:tetratricopeptide repeat protein 21B-like [Atheta coriaria]|uniref:tetratricopeptide repeat protein 21B-like n=1 Tax=Dalotia coriaria TaxID=877792 RepID=UPI0031F3CF6B